MFGAAGLLLVPIGVLWLTHEARQQVRRRRKLPPSGKRYYFAVASLIVATLVAVPISLLISMGVGLSLGLFALALSLFSVVSWIPSLKLMKTAEAERVNAISHAHWKYFLFD